MIRNTFFPCSGHVWPWQDEGGREGDQARSDEEYDEWHLLARYGHHSPQREVSQASSLAQWLYLELSIFLTPASTFISYKRIGSNSLLFSIREHDQARRAFLMSIKCDPTNENTLRELVQLQVHLRDFPGFEESARKILMGKPSLM